jgi:phosphate uptake regulator
MEKEKAKLRIDAEKQSILISDDEIDELCELMKATIKPGMKKSDVSPKIQQTIKNYFHSLIQQSE